MEEQEPVAGCMLSPSIHLGGAAFGCGQETYPRFSANNLTGVIDTPSVHDDDFEVTRLPQQVVQRLWKNLFLIERWNNDRNHPGPRPDEIATLFRLSAFSGPLSAGLFQRAIHRLVDCEEMPLSWVGVNFRTEHGADLIRGHASHTGVEPAQVGPLLSIGKSKVESVNDSDGIGLLLPFA